ncbi:MAG TPA: glycosyltransferase family 2 protein [bacterium]|nr:glycosyltransferase family 2 protein [bacterium]HNT65462.1 glycosyltransferase family 2 protein [bacterium]HOX87154.1 glycosyltransferase family 2 protein [bacterium]HPG46485.1 glycosyltransferase family 2 protein [bacterium]HPM98602.1 glycosyltransferase family 2 protein [bacterium]
MNAAFFNSILIAIPVYNEAPFVAHVLQQVLEQVPAHCVVVVDDGSTDGTAEISAAFPVQVIRCDRNLGKGRALQRAFQLAIESKKEWILTLDGDGQHDPKDFPRFFDCIRTQDYDVYIGDRRNRGSMPLQRRLSNGVSSIFLSLCAGNQRIRDSQCGYRALRTGCIPLTRLCENGFQFESEVLLRMGKMGCRFSQVSVNTHYGDELSSIRPFRDTVRFIALVLKSLFW